ncbi:hypothetical protein HMPREF1060_03720 [Parabacteroides merdae CL03T12C32]|uniref:Conjugal transfer protein TraG n=2 Tax=Bacteroidales TaxID=171549 RepID=K5Z7X5_9BACT|nr:hypothetical protein HMPREF1060_03720 [Parabacteroides merdae CL03T12C32]KAB4155123.1 hypothetical protein GAQ47_20510 [Bacteroides uniformis]
MVNFRLIKLVESRIHREVYVRFGGEYPKIRHRNMKMDVGCLAYVMNTVGNIFSGQVVGETAKTLSERFGKVLQKRQSISINRQDVSTSINTQMDALIPPSKISGLTQGMFVGSVSDNFNERIEQKIFHCEIVVDAEKVKREESAYKKIPVITNFTDEDGNDRMKETVQANYRRIKEEVKQIVQEELERIKNDPVLCKLLPDNETV